MTQNCVFQLGFNLAMPFKFRVIFKQGLWLSISKAQEMLNPCKIKNNTKKTVVKQSQVTNFAFKLTSDFLIASLVNWLLKRGFIPFMCKYGCLGFQWANWIEYGTFFIFPPGDLGRIFLYECVSAHQTALRWHGCLSYHDKSPFLSEQCGHIFQMPLNPSTISCLVYLNSRSPFYWTMQK